jgi:hypothetical protein
MAVASSKSTLPAKPQPIGKLTAEQRAQAMARMATMPTYNAAGVVQAFSIHGELDYGELRDVLVEQCEAVEAGNLGRVTGTLVAQAHSLDAIFVKLARRAEDNMREHFSAAEALLKLALKAQSQCRATLETLAAIKSPPTVFAQQANIAHGHQQVNNGPAPARADAIKNRPNELLDGNHGERLDSGTEGPAGASDPAMATVATIDGAAHRRRQGGQSR